MKTNKNIRKWQSANTDMGLVCSLSHQGSRFGGAYINTPIKENMGA